ncbi:MAG: glycosyltransferase family 2 protein [Rhodocyclales bacterium]|nr:glycosyltransferase family 2 protein [Rhodocyclales bacterium]
MAIVVFWLAVLFIAYTYVGYPLGVWLLARRRPEETPEQLDACDWPPITVVIAVYNEAQRIARKIANLRNLDYPQEKMSILFVSDGSTDATNELLAKASGISWHAYAERRGKPYALNCGLQRVGTEIVVFCDVRQEIERTAFKHLIGRLVQPGVGAVSGELVHRDPQSHVAANIGLYWRYEKWIRRSESRVASSIGATGALYAIHRSDFEPLAEDTILDDFEIPMAVVRRGRRNVFEHRAIFFDELQQDTAGERKRKVRTLTGNYQAFSRHRWLFSPRQNPVFVQFMSHKVFRLLVPYALMLALGASLAAEGWFYAGIAVVQVAFYTIAIAGSRAARMRSNRIVSFAVVFLELNWAAVLALVNFLSSRTDAKWEKT